MPNGLNIFVFHNCAKLFKVFFSGSRRGGRSTIQLHETCWLIKKNLEIKFPTICKEEKQTWEQLQKEKKRLVKSKRKEERKKHIFCLYGCDGLRGYLAAQGETVSRIVSAACEFLHTPWGRFTFLAAGQSLFQARRRVGTWCLAFHRTNFGQLFWCSYPAFWMRTLVTGIYPMTPLRRFPAFLSSAPSTTWLRNGPLVFDSLDRGGKFVWEFV